MTGHGPRPLASPPCMAGEVAEGRFGAMGTDPQQARDVAVWRRAERIRLAGLRNDLGQARRAEVSTQIRQQLGRVLEARLDRPGMVLAGYWPIKGEPDLRPLLAALHDRGVLIALPVVETRAAPLVFRHWTPQTRLQRSDWNIPAPPVDAPVVTPDVVLAPCLGWDDNAYRLGWGGGYFDRTLATPGPRPHAIGIALEAARLPTIFPQPHDIALDLIVTEAGVRAERMTER